MRVFQIGPAGIRESDQLPVTVPEPSIVWISCSRAEFESASERASIQAALQALCSIQLVDLHISDLLNTQLPSRYDYTAQYDLLVFRRLASAGPANGSAGAGAAAGGNSRRSGPPILRRIDTSPVGFAIFDNVLLSVDSYLDLRRELSRQLDHWQAELLAPNTRFTNWGALLDARLSLHALDDVAEDQRTAMQDWIAALETWPLANSSAGRREHDLLKVRSRDVLEHIERVVRHVRRLEQNAETTVQMHFSAQGHRTNEIMRTLTVLTAVFLPLNLITGFFGMNFDFLPLVHRQAGIWWAVGIMSVLAVGLVAVFWRKRYLARTAR